MSAFSVPVVRVASVRDHPNADRLSVLQVLGYEAVTAKNEDGSHRFVEGEAVVYVPEFAVVPETLLKRWDFWDEARAKGMLAGSRGNRVKAIKLRGVFSQGLVIKKKDVPVAWWPLDDTQPTPTLDVGDDVAEYLGIQKYEEPIPTSMSGDLVSLPEARLDYDIENIKNFPDFLALDEVEVTEKLHGTFCRISYLGDIFEPRDDLFGDGRVAISSKGLGARGLVFKNTVKNREQNLYVRTLLDSGIIDRVVEYFQSTSDTVHIMGEVFGRGVQDLTYGEQTPTFRAFDVAYAVGNRVPQYCGPFDKAELLSDLEIDRVPVLYRGLFDREKIDELVDGVTTYGTGANIREGVVITTMGPQEPRRADEKVTLRPILKHVSEAYLLRKGGTELQ